MTQRSVQSLGFVRRDAALAAVQGRASHFVNTVAEAYILHAQRRTENPPSVFLRIPGRAPDRAIALPAFVGGDRNIWGMKWISSVPGNVECGLPRASGVVVLNDPETGFPFALVEAGVVNAVRTAASAALGARYLHPGGPTDCVLGIVGMGPIASACLSYLVCDGWKFSKVLAYDLDQGKALALSQGERFAELDVEVCTSIDQVTKRSDLLLFATTATEPHVSGVGSLKECPTILHVSLRDLDVEVIAAAQNVVDDVDLCLRERTSLHLTEMALGKRDFVSGTIVELMTGLVLPDAARPRVFSPFGMGILDVVVAEEIYRQAASTGGLVEVPEFFGSAAQVV